VRYQDAYKVYSLTDEEGEPHLEATFTNEFDAQSYVECWQSLYDRIEFWIEFNTSTS
jgi:DNA-dependent RNA polymerase auxiliary subunit epsilon